MLLGVESSEESYLLKIPPLLKFILAKERNSRVLEEQEILRKFSSLSEKILETSYLLEDQELYKMFLEDLLNQTETTLKRYMGMQIIMQSRSGFVDNDKSQVKEWNTQDRPADYNVIPIEQ